MKRLSLTLMSLMMAFIGFAQSPCSQLNASMTVSQSSNTVTITNTSTLPTGGTNVSSWAYASWGDGSYGYPNPTDNHTYTTNGTFTITFYQSWMDSTGANSVYCTDTAYQTVTITTAPPPPVNCNFTATSVNNGNGNYTFTATGNNTTGMSYNWNFGDGNTATGNPVTHTYANNGTYLVIAVGSGNGCTSIDSVLVNYQGNPNPSSNEISGYIDFDSTVLNSTVNSLSFKVWLIQASYDSSVSSFILNAVDSLATSPGTPWAFYQFNNKPAGNYYVKARVAPGTTNPGLVPTYHQASAMWNTATQINHTGGSSIYKHIHLISGTPTTGPGFIGGNVSLGAGKGTSAGIANQLVLLRDGSNNVVASTYTDANGDYSFGSLANGTYSIYPEEMNYQTIPSAAMVIGAGVNTYNYVDFEKNSNTIKPKTSAVKDVVNNLFSIYPNPTKGQVNISWKETIKGDVQIMITDIAGRVVNRTETTVASTTQIHLNNLNQGIYFIKINTAKGQYTERIVLQ